MVGVLNATILVVLRNDIATEVWLLGIYADAEVVILFISKVCADVTGGATRLLAEE